MTIYLDDRGWCVFSVQAFANTTFFKTGASSQSKLVEPAQIATL